MEPWSAALALRDNLSSRFEAWPPQRRRAFLFGVTLGALLALAIVAPEPAHAQNLESFAQNVRGILSSTLLRTLAVIAVILTGLLWLLGRASTQILVTVIIGIAIIFSADAIVGAIAG